MADEKADKKTDKNQQNQHEGQLSEVSGLRDPDVQVSDGDAVAGQPDGADDGPAGPDAVTFDDKQDRRPDPDDTETTG